MRRNMKNVLESCEIISCTPVPLVSYHLREETPRQTCNKKALITSGMTMELTSGGPNDGHFGVV